MRRKIFIIAIVSLVLFSVKAQDRQNFKPDSVKFFTVFNSDTLPFHFETLTPHSFTYYKKYYYPFSSRMFKIITGSYANGQPIGQWVWFTSPQNPKSRECSQAGPLLQVNYSVDSIIINHLFTPDLVVKHIGKNSLSGVIHPNGLKSTRFYCFKNQCKLLDLHIEETLFGHYYHLERLLLYLQSETKIHLLSPPIKPG